jgi:hypothetical protein
MAEAQSSPQVIQMDSSAVSVRARLIWASRPLGFLLVAFWVLHPSSTAHADYLHLPLVGFLVGICYGLVMFWEKLRDYIGITTESHRFAVNRMPDEYYWGAISETLFRNK